MNNWPNVINLCPLFIILLLHSIADQVNLTGTEAGNRRPQTGKGIDRSVSGLLSPLSHC